MHYGTVPGIRKPVSRLVQGTVMINSRELDKGFALLDGILERGCTTFDTAHVYGSGDNERSVGRWVNDRGVRERVVVIGKGAHHNQDRRRVTPHDITSDLYDSLARFQFDYIDLYLLHRDDPSVPVGPIVEVLNEHQRAGRIHAFGGSNWTAARVREANAYAAAHGLTPFVAASPQYSLAEMVAEPWPECVSIGGPARADQREWYQAQRIPLFCWSSLAGGLFSGRLTRENAGDHRDTLYVRSYGGEANFARLDRVRALAAEKGLSVPQVALAYVMNQPLELFALVGCATPEEFQANVDALQVRLTAEELAWLDLQRDTR